MGVFHRSPGFEALSPGRDEEEEEEDSGVSARLVLTSLPEMVYLCAVPNPSQAQGVLALAIKRVTLVGFWFGFFFWCLVLCFFFHWLPAVGSTGNTGAFPDSRGVSVY